ncbi:hypothetical protein BH09CHL1_BH09CHL1_09140 [soil metagenome]
MIPFGRRRLVVSIVPASGLGKGASNPYTMVGAESDIEFAKLAARRRATLERAHWDIYSVMHQSPRLH